MASNPLFDYLNQARENLDMVAEAEVRLAAAGQVSLATWEKQAAAVNYLASQMKRTEEQEKKESANLKTLRTSFEGVQKSALIAGATLTATFAEIRHFAASANPGLFQAMDGAMQILQARIGGALLPAIEATIETIMDVADWFDNLGDGTKKIVAGGMVAIPAVIALGSAARALGPVLASATAAMKSMNAAAREHAMISNMATVAGGAAGAIGILALLHGTEGPEGRGIFGASSPGSLRAGRPSEDEMKFAWEALRASHGLNMSEWNALNPQQRRDYSAKESERLNAIAKKGGESFFGSNGMLYSRVSEEDASKASDILGRFSRTGKEGFEGKNETRWRERVSRLNMVAATVGREQQARYSPLAEARKQLQVAALGKNPFEQQLLQEQRKVRLSITKKLDELIQEGRKKGYRLFEPT